jgi:hypothetical protein
MLTASSPNPLASPFNHWRYTMIEDLKPVTLEDCAIDLFEDAYIKHKDEHTVTLVINREIWDMLESFCKS